MKKALKIGIGVVFVIVLVLFALIGLRTARRRNEAAGNVPRAGVLVDAEASHRETIVTKVSAKGTVSLVEQTVVYAQSSAKIDEITVKVGDIVTVGQDLVRYDTAALENLEESMKDAKLSYQIAEINLRNLELPASETERLQAEQSVKSSEKAISDLAAQLEQTDISLDQVNRNLVKTIETHAKNEQLFAQGAISQNDYDASADAVTKLEEQRRTTESQRATQVQAIANAESSLSLSRKQYSAVVNKSGDPKLQNQIDLQLIQLEQAQRQIDKLQKQIDEYVSIEHSPGDGVVLSVTATAGEMASQGRALLTIADTSTANLVITVYIPEGDAHAIEEGAAVEITGGALGAAEYTGTIFKIYPLAEMKPIGTSQETAITVEIAADDMSIPLRAGYTVETNIITHVAADVVVVPLMSVITESNGQSYVYIMKPDYTAERRNVVLKTYANLYVEAEGVAEGETVIVNPSAAVQPGVTVRPSY